MSIKNWPGGRINKTPPTPSGPYENSTAPGVWTLDQQAYWQKQGQWPTAGSVNPDVFIENLFSTYLYAGNDSTQTITNGIDLAGKGGLVWTKSRNDVLSHSLADTNRGAFRLLSDSTTSQLPLGITYNSNGFTMGVSGSQNASGYTYVSWTFREQPKFFDVVTYTGTGGGPSSVAHALGSVPGFLIIKSTSRTGNWICVARRSNGNYALFTANAGLNLTSAANQPDNANVISSGALSATTFDPSWFNSSGAVGNVDNICDNGVTYVAYLFAHNAGGFGLTGTDNVISCGSFTYNSTSGNTINLGYEPQWILLKRSDGAGTWYLQDTMRGMTADDTGSRLFPNTSSAEDAAGFLGIYASGFKIGSSIFSNGANLIYIAIRRGPMKTPTTGTSVFSPNTYTGTGATLSVSGISFPPDLVIPKWRSNGGGGYSTRPGALYDKLRGAQQELAPTSSAAESTQSTGLTSFNQSGFTIGTSSVINSSPDPYISWNFLRAPGFFDEVCYTGTLTTLNVSHNLGAVPQLIITKSRSATGNWTVQPLSNGTQMLRLNTTAAQTSDAGPWNNTNPTNSVFTLGADTGTNSSGVTYVAYLFATVAGVSKVGSYTGTAALQTIDCGFASGARFVLIKRTDATGDWYVWDSARGISSSTDPYLLLNSTAAEVTGTNYVDTTAVGFQVTAAAPAAINANGGSFVFLAIA